MTITKEPWLIIRIKKDRLFVTFTGQATLGNNLKISLCLR